MAMNHRFEVFFDGECPLCKREIDALRLLDFRRRVLFTDISAADFDAAAVGKSYRELMDVIHGRMPDGQFVTGVETFRQLYAALGFGPLVALSRLPGVRHLLDLGYHWFARNRLRLTGRCLKDEQGNCTVATSGPAPLDSSLN
jgi:predicted DCC family thiol-disulfide oxidoreductase YuxK